MIYLFPKQKHKEACLHQNSKETDDRDQTETRFHNLYDPVPLAIDACHHMQLPVLTGDQHRPGNAVAAQTIERLAGCFRSPLTNSFDTAQRFRRGGGFF